MVLGCVCSVMQENLLPNLDFKSGFFKGKLEI
jgi:hypothetical protein